MFRNVTACIAAGGALVSTMVGCAGAMGRQSEAGFVRASIERSVVDEETKNRAQARTAERDGNRQDEDRALPPAPWSADPLEPEATPGPVVRAWRDADNRERCAPIAPRDLGEGAGASSRIGTLHGGWAVEFDKSGAPGMREDGSPCDRCGRASFGVAGTALTPAELEGAGGDARKPARSFDDGSSADFDLPGGQGSATAATLTVSGQDCIYQVWSFLGERHARELVRKLRFVAVPERDAPNRVAELRLFE